jgi:hypothetical protein
MNQTLKTKQRRKGQTMAEFAITLPILLILVFGVIEFGRVFQAWVTLQNAARTAARYASTGRFNEQKYPVTENLESDPGSIVDCVLNEDFRGSPSVLTVNGESVNIYQGGAESLFATWYDGENCEPNRIDHQDLRKDIARILSIIDEARRGAAGLALGPDPLIDVNTQEEVEDFLYSQWDRPLPGGGQFNFHAGWDQPAYFDVMICSSRGMRNPSSGSYYRDVGTRFFTGLDALDVGALQKFDGNADDKNAQRAPVCLLNEFVPLEGGALQNAGTPWLDAGGPGDAVTVVINFNHPLITPLGLAPYIPLQARRAAVNEAFRAADATGALQGSAPLQADPPAQPIARLKINNPLLPGPGNIMEIQSTDLDENGTYPVLLDGSDSIDTDGPNGKPVRYVYELNVSEGEVWVLADLLISEGGEIPDPNAPTPQKPEGRFHFAPGTYEVTLTVYDNEGQSNTTSITFMIKLPDPPVPPSDTPTPTDTPTGIPPFQCDLITASNVSFFNNRVWIQIHNGNFKPTVMSRVDFHWRKLPQFPNMYVAGMSLDGNLHWRGQDFEPSTNSHSPDDPSNPPDMFFSADRTVPGEDTVTWEGVFANGPAPIQDTANNIIWMTPAYFGGSTWTFDNPEGGSPCVIPLTGTTPTATPTLAPGQNSPTPTWTPDCAGTDITIRFENFDTFGVVRLLVTNRRVVPANFTDFNINWVKRSAGPQVLERVVAGGSSAADLTNGTLIWHSGSANEDDDAPTKAGTTAASTPGREGTWVTNYSFPPLSTTNLWIKFGVTNSTPDSAFGMAQSDLNGSWFQIGCGTPPNGQNGNWYGGDGRITIFQEPTPLPTNTQGPTRTPRPTLTPSKTFTPGPPTNTPRPATITNTPRPSNTPPPSPTRTEAPPGGGGNDGSVDG